MKKIVILSPAHPLRGGIASSSERLAQEFQLAGYEVVVYSFSLQYPSFLFPGKTQYTDDPPPENLKIIPALNSINPFNWLKVGAMLRRETPDLIVVRFWIPFMGPSLGTALRVARLGRRMKVVCIADNIIPHEKRPFDRLFTSWFIRSTDAFLVMSKAVGEELRQFTTTMPWSYVPHPVYDNYGPLAGREESLAQLGLPPGKRYLLFFGFIREYKGLDILLRALADPVLAEFSLHLLVGGEFYEDASRYTQLIEQLGIRDRVTIYDQYIPKERVRYYFGAADLVVQPYRSATQSGISQLAYHFEKPMVVTRVGGLPEIVDHERSGYVVDVSPDAVAAAIRDFFEKERATEMTAAVRAEQYRFSWAYMVQTLETIYKDLQQRAEP